MITKISLKNWRSHLNSTLEFSKGTNAMIGIMGSGKSSVLGAICFALFGTNPEVQSRKLKLDDIIMNKPSVKDMAEVEVFFRVGGNDYSVKRIIERKKGTSYSELRANGKLLEAPSTQRVNEMVEKILKVDYELFTKAIYSEQNSIDYFLTIPKGQRMRKIDELLMIDKFERARANTISLTNRVLDKKNAAESMISNSNISNIDQDINALNVSLESITTEKISMEEELKLIMTSKADIESDLELLYKAKEDFESLKRDEISLSSAMAEIVKTLEKLEHVKNFDLSEIENNMRSFSEVLGKMQQHLIDKQDVYRKISDQYSKSKAEAEFYQKETISRLNNEIEEKLQLKQDADKIRKAIGDDKEKALEKKRLIVEKYVGEIEALKIKIEDLMSVIDQLESVKATCPICESKLTEARKIILIKQKRKQVRDFYESIDSAAKQKQMNEHDLRDLEVMIGKLDRILVELENLENLKGKLTNAQDIYSVLEESSSKLEKELEISRKDFDKISKTIEESRNEKQKAEILFMQKREFEEKRYRLSDLMRQREAISNHLSAVEKSISGRDLSSTEAHLRNIVGRERELSTRISSLNQIYTEREKRLSELENILRNVTREKENIKKLENIATTLKIFEKSLEQTQMQLRQEFITLVNYSMNQLWQTIYPYQDFIGIRLNVEEGDYALQLQSRNEWVNVEGMVSGGERSMAALALRISFSLVLAPQLRILVLDEPTANLDQAGISKLSEALRERAGEFLDQIFVITHEPRLEEAITGLGYRLERDKASDGYTQIVQLN